jgi:putative ABC transport system permease protein
MNLLVLVAYVVGVLVIGLVLYAGVLERVREYGIMKALGTRNSRLYEHVMGQAAVFTAAGLAVGLLASLGVAALFAWLLPQYLVVVGDATVLLRVGVAALLMALVASAFPVRQVAEVDPAMVFRQ